MDNQTGIHKFMPVALIAISSYNRESRNQTKWLRKYMRNTYIHYVLGAEDVEHAKPQPDAVLKTLKELGFTPEETLVVGDMTYDILMGSRAGAHTCGVTYGNGTREELLSVNAESIIDDFEQLLTICQE